MFIHPFYYNLHSNIYCCLFTQTKDKEDTGQAVNRLTASRVLTVKVEQDILIVIITMYACILNVLI